MTDNPSTDRCHGGCRHFARRHLKGGAYGRCTDPGCMCGQYEPAPSTDDGRCPECEDCGLPEDEGAHPGNKKMGEPQNNGKTMHHFRPSVSEGDARIERREDEIAQELDEVLAAAAKSDRGITGQTVAGGRTQDVGPRAQEELHWHLEIVTRRAKSGRMSRSV